MPKDETDAYKEDKNEVNENTPQDGCIVSC